MVARRFALILNYKVGNVILVVETGSLKLILSGMNNIRFLCRCFHYSINNPLSNGRGPYTFLQSRGRRNKPFLEVYLAGVSPYVSPTLNVYDDLES